MIDVYEKVKSESFYLPPLFVDLISLLSEIESDTFDFESLAKKVESSPTLVANIIKVANSSYYGLANKVETLSHAIGIIGVRDFISIVFGSFLQMIVEGIGIEKEEGSRFWIHSFACSEIAGKITGNYKGKICGLLHDIGKIILRYFYKSDYRLDKIYSEREEERKFGASHSKIGAFYLKNIGVSEEIVEAVENHHKPPSRDTSDLSSILYFSNLISHYLFGNFVFNVNGTPVSLSSEDLSKIKEKVITIGSEILGSAISVETGDIKIEEFSKMLSVFLNTVSRGLPETFEELMEEFIKIIFDISLYRSEVILQKGKEVKIFSLNNGRLQTDVIDESELDSYLSGSIVLPMILWGDTIGYVKLKEKNVKRSMVNLINSLISIYSPKIYLFNLYSTDFLFHSLYRRMENFLPFGTIIVSEDGNIVNINEKMLELFCIDGGPDTVRGRSIDAVFGEKLSFLKDLWRFEANIDIPRKEIDGRFFRIAGRITREKGKKYLAAIFLDVTREVERERKLETLSITDPLTGVYNQRFFYEMLSKEIRKARDRRSPLILMMLDLDNFKEINDKKGHLYGDKVLKRVAEIIVSSVREGLDSVFRYGGDEFAIILPGANDKSAKVVFSRIKEKLVSNVGVSISGGAVLHKEGYSVERFVNEADKVLYLAKREKGGKLVLKS